MKNISFKLLLKEEHQKCFEHSKSAMCRVPSFSHSIENKGFILFSDASDYAARGVALQRSEGQKKANYISIVFFSKT